MGEGPAFDVSSRRLGPETALISVVGEVDLWVAPDFKAPITEAIDEGAREVLVDVSGTTFMDSTALGVLVGAKKRLHKREGSVVIVGSTSLVRRMFEISGLDRLFEFRDQIPDEA